ncbi:MAG: hypothetical protein JO093_01850 [Acidobacteria bacterium]|nr:hypothetical protein [Acidobacteriota bacterium]MBV9069257.1 hypothetical protein [Acidobacteriota bacterium]MBV9184327.1 hypothetical protein [Acidobacteriota bacterium]
MMPMVYGPFIVLGSAFNLEDGYITEINVDAIDGKIVAAVAHKSARKAAKDEKKR